MKFVLFMLKKLFIPENFGLYANLCATEAEKKFFWYLNIDLKGAFITVLSTSFLKREKWFKGRDLKG